MPPAGEAEKRREKPHQLQLKTIPANYHDSFLSRDRQGAVDNPVVYNETNGYGGTIPMTGGRWQQVERLYLEAAARPPSERVSFLDKACGGDAGLRGEVERMLAGEASAEGFLEAPAVEVAARTLATAPAPLAPGHRIGPYEIVSLAGSGGMGEVYKARDTRLKRTVAVKVLPAFVAQDPERRDRLLREARAASALSHPNIVTLYDIVSVDGSDSLVMEYLEGQTLDQKIKPGGLPLCDVLHCATQMAAALAAAHSAGIVHRDVKPGNIMVTTSGTVKVLDFGLAKHFHAPGEGPPTTDTALGRTQEGMIAGTVAYMSPEQAEGKPVDVRSDIFSFGSVLYEMVTGRRAFPGDTPVSTMAAILKQEPAPLGAKFPSELEKVIARCLRKDPARRYQHMDDVKIALEELRERPAPSRRRWLRVAGFATLAAVVILVGWWRLASREAGPAPDLVPTPLTAYPGMEAWPTFSPDGNQVAFAWNGEKQDNFDIYVKMTGPGAPLRLTTDSALDVAPSWSPDGRWIAFVRYPKERELKFILSSSPRLMLVSVLGGEERVLADSVGVGLQVSWSPDSRWVFAVQSSEVVRISPETGEKRVVISPPASTYYAQPAISPDGRRLAVSRYEGLKRRAVFLQRMTSDYEPEGGSFEVSTPNLNTYYPAWTADGRGILFAGSASVVYTTQHLGWPTGLWRVPAAGGVARRLAFAGDNPWTLAISRNGRLCYARWQSDWNIYRAGLEPDGMIRKPAVPWLPSSFPDENAQYSPDGKMVVFSSARGGSQEIWLANADGSNPHPLTSRGGHYTGSPRWSPDGKTIAFHSRPRGTGHGDICSISTDGTGFRRLTEGTALNARASFSRDGKWIYFMSERTEPNEIWKVPAAGGPAVRVTQNGGWLAQESPDRQWLYFTKQQHHGALWRMPLEGGNEEQVAESVANFSAFAVVERGVYYISGQIIYFRSHSLGPPKAIGKLDHPPYFGLSLSPDGKHIMYTQRDRLELDLMLVENFR